jgi:hypothetical protein
MYLEICAEFGNSANAEILMSAHDDIQTISVTVQLIRIPTRY